MFSLFQQLAVSVLLDYGGKNDDTQARMRAFNITKFSLALL